MKHLLILSLLTISFLASGAELSTKEKIAKEVVQASLYSEFSELRMLAYAKAIGQKVVFDTSPEEYENISAQVNERLTAWSDNFYKKHNIDSKLESAYIDSFTEDELNDILQFYKSDTGKKLLQVLPLIINLKSEFQQEFVEGFLNSIEESK
ncbi:DUF2059 domain-containing protein [Alteromonas flava]|uniref:DUF2059 domain-containing protein n=1 Tax=Alteromonas flava TaxID=2048003 RepID=UPI000C290063|nr:DUF2059 domain-containing protein [Alteromonas flava]